jgi:cytochrome c2
MGKFITIVSLVFFFGLDQCKNTSKIISGKAETDSAKTFQEFVEHLQFPKNLTWYQYKGKLIYERYCQVCHGVDGDGKGFNSFNLESSFGTKPIDFTDSTNFVKLSNEEIRKAISTGGKSIGKSQYMPPWGFVLTNKDVQNVVKYIKTFSKTE